MILWEYRSIDEKNELSENIDQLTEKWILWEYRSIAEKKIDGKILEGNNGITANYSQKWSTLVSIQKTTSEHLEFWKRD